jgi:hypothetical protein
MALEVYRRSIYLVSVQSGIERNTVDALFVIYFITIHQMMGIRQLLFQLIAFNSFATIPFAKALAFRSIEREFRILKKNNTAYLV